MSENSIDVDVNFHINDINKIFEKIMEGANTDMFKGLSDITDLDDKTKASFINQLSSTDDKTKLLETINKLNLESPIMDNIIKMVTNLFEDSEYDTEILERTHSNLLTMLNISKVMFKLVNERFPLTEEIQDKIEEMGKIIIDEERDLDDRLDIITRTLNSMLATSTGQNDAFRIITPETDITDILPHDLMSLTERSEFKSNAENVELLIQTMNEATKDTRVGTKKFKEMTINAGESIIRMGEVLDQAQQRMLLAVDDFKVSDEVRISALEERMGQGRGGEQRQDIGFNQFIEQMLQLTTLIGAVKEEFVKITKDSAEALQNMDVATDAIIQLYRDLDPDKVGITAEQIKNLETVIKEGIEAIKETIGENIDEEIMANMFESAIKARLIAEPLDTQKRRHLDFYIKLIESTFNRLMVDYETLIKDPKARQTLADAGLKNIISLPRIIKTAKDVVDDFDPLHDTVFAQEAGTSNIDLSTIEAMFNEMHSIDLQVETHVGKIQTDIGSMLIEIKNITAIAGKTETVVDNLDKGFGSLKGAIISASDQILSTHNALKSTNEKVNEVINKVTENNPGKDIDPFQID